MVVIPLSLLLRHLRNQLSLLQPRPQIIQHQNLHLLLRLVGIRADVGKQHDSRVTQQTGVNLWLFLVHVQASRADLYRHCQVQNLYFHNLKPSYLAGIKCGY